jgi:hypothetical protein
MIKVLKWLTRRFDTRRLKEHERTYKMTQGKFNMTSRIYPFQKDQHKWVIAIELSRIRSRSYWLSTPLHKIKMHWWVDDYVMVQSWCTWYGAMWHVAMQCSQSYGTNSLNPWVLPSNFSELNKDAQYWKQYRNDLLETADRHTFKSRGVKVGCWGNNPPWHMSYPDSKNRTEVSIHVLRMFKSHVQRTIWWTDTISC